MWFKPYCLVVPQNFLWLEFHMVIFHGHLPNKGDLLLPSQSLPYAIHSIPAISIIEGFIITAFCRILYIVVFVWWRRIFILTTSMVTRQLGIHLHFHRYQNLHWQNNSKSFQKLLEYYTFSITPTCFSLFPKSPRVFSTHDMNRKVENY